MSLKGKRQSPEHIKKRIESLKRTYALKPELQENFRENGKRLDAYLKNNPDVEAMRRINIGKSMKGNKKRIEALTNHPNTIASQFKKGFDKRRTGSLAPWPDERRKATAERMSVLAKTQVGDKSPRWKGGITDANQKIRNGLKHKEWARAVYERDFFACQECGTHCLKNYIVAHHIESFAECEALRFEIENGKTMCRKCHIKLHRMENDGLHLYYNGAEKLAAGV